MKVRACFTFVHMTQWDALSSKPRGLNADRGLQVFVAESQKATRRAEARRYIARLHESLVGPKATMSGIELQRHWRNPAKR